MKLGKINIKYKYNISGGFKRVKETLQEFYKVSGR